MKTKDGKTLRVKSNGNCPNPEHGICEGCGKDLPEGKTVYRVWLYSYGETDRKSVV